MTETWDTLADWYTEQVRAGSPMHAFARDVLLDALPPDLTGQRVLDVGCGEGLIARAVAARGAEVTGVDPSPRMIAHARDADGDGVRYAVDDGRTLDTVADGSTDWVTAGLSLNNVPDLDAALRAVRRVLTTAGHLAFTVPHPCFEAPHAAWTDEGRRVVGDYAAEGFWRSSNPCGARRAGNQHRTLGTYFTALLAHGFALEAVAEPLPDAPLATAQPHRAELPPFLLLRAVTA